jgi:hypothetical protein
MNWVALNRLVVAWMASLSFLLVVGACGSTLQARSLSSVTHRCRDEARAAYYSGDASVDEAENVYDRCLRREGVQ